MRFTLFTVSLLLIAVLAVGLAQVLAQEDPHAHHNMVGWVPLEILERPTTIREGIGKISDTVTTSSREAQAFYDQGLAYLHSYVWIEAARSFYQALRHDPNLAVAYLGLSYAYSGLEENEKAHAMLGRAQSLASRASQRERQRIEIRARQLQAMAAPDNLLKHLEFKNAIDAALAVWPDDAELWLLRGNAEEPRPSGRGQRGGAATIAFYEAALKRLPDHFAAHHYLTHTYETIGQADRALVHGEVYARLAPAIPHAQHMYGHDLRRVGRIDEAIKQFEKSRKLEETYFEAEKIRPELDWHYAHNLSLLATAYQYEGRMREAEKLFDQLFALPKFTAYSELWGKEWPEFLFSRGRKEEALAAGRQVVKSKWAAVRSVGHALAGSVLLVMKGPKEAQAELVEAERELKQIVPVGSLGVTPEIVKPYLDALRGEILLRSGEHPEGARLLKEVQRQIRAIPGPDAWIQALFRLESIARTAQEAGNWELAEYTAKQMLEHDASYAGTHYALALVAEHKGDTATARNEFAAAVKLWGKADADLPELRHARGEKNTKQEERSRNKRK
jgi:tetratricopeptide (TPR) repeat protein